MPDRSRLSISNYLDEVTYYYLNYLTSMEPSKLDKAVDELDLKDEIPQLETPLS